MNALARIPRRSPTRSVVWALVTSGAATLLALALPHRSPASAASIDILGVVAAAALGGIWSGVLASVLSFVGLNYYFTVPYHTFAVHRPDELVALAVFLAVAGVVAALVARMVAERDRAERSTSEARSLASFTGRLLSDEPLERTLQVAAESLVVLFDLSSCAIDAIVDGEPILVHAPRNRAREKPTFEIPLRAGTTQLGMLSIGTGPKDPPPPAWNRDAIGAFAAQVAVALQRANSDAETRRARVDAEASDTRAALFSSVTHDLRTPLASITASVSSLLGSDVAYDAEQREELLRTSLEEANRLNRMVANLVDLARMRAGALEPTTQPMPIEDVVESVLRRMQPALRGFRVVTRIRPDLPLVSIDPIQIDQALTNIIENAVRFSSPGGEIHVSANTWQAQVELRVSDDGPGIPLEERDRVFEPFYRRDAGSGRGGTGLGLAIARAVVLAHGGRIRIEGTPAGGTAVVFEIPAVARDPVATPPAR